MTGFTFPGMIEEPGWTAGRLISASPVFGPEASSLRSPHIRTRSVARVRSAALAHADARGSRPGPEGACRHHCQDPVDEAKLAGWFGREPNYRIVVEEPFRPNGHGRRLIAYFHTPGQPFRLRDFRRERGRPRIPRPAPPA